MTKQPNEIITAWVTKYALSTGILKVEGQWDPESPHMFAWKHPDTMWNFAHGSNWHRTEAEAYARAEEMRVLKIVALHKQIVRMEAITFP